MYYKINLFFAACLICLGSMFISSQAEAADQWIDDDGMFSYYARGCAWSSDETECRTTVIKVNNSSGATIQSRIWIFTQNNGEWYCTVYGNKGIHPVEGNYLAQKVLDYLLTLQ